MDWMDAKKGKFSIKSLYNFLRQEISKVLPTRVIWNAMASTKVRFFFAWEAYWGITSFYIVLKLKCYGI